MDGTCSARCRIYCSCSGGGSCILLPQTASRQPPAAVAASSCRVPVASPHCSSLSFRRSRTGSVGRTSGYLSLGRNAAVTGSEKLRQALAFQTTRLRRLRNLPDGPKRTKRLGWTVYSPFVYALYCLLGTCRVRV